MKIVNIVISGKGGSGKSHSSTVLSQYIRDHIKADMQAFDTDQVNPTLTEYPALNVVHFSVIDSNNKFNSRLFDVLIEEIVNSSAPHIVIDTGSNTFIPLLEYAASINIFQQLRDFDCKVVFHLLLCGGDLYATTLSGVQSVLEQFKVESVIWLNEYFGDLDKFKDERIFQNDYEYRSLIKGIMLLPFYDKDTFGEDIRMMASKKLTLNEALKSPEFGMVSRMRLNKVYMDYYKRLDALNITFSEND